MTTPKTKPSDLGLELINQLVERVATENGLDKKAETALLQDAYRAIHAGQLPTRDSRTTSRITDLRHPTAHVTVSDFNAWMDQTGSVLIKPSTLRRDARNPHALNSQWEGRTASDFIEEKKKYVTFTAAAKAHGVSRQRYTQTYYRAVGKPEKLA